jgi:hypothetical protein
MIYIAGLVNFMAVGHYVYEREWVWALMAFGIGALCLAAHYFSGEKFRVDQ